MQKSIAILSTGDELVQGDILNTTGPWLATQLIEAGFKVACHLIVSDEQAEIEAALHYLLTFNQVVITTGGLGPTSDDRTRFAISQVLNQPLLFHEPSWQQICTILNRYQVPVTDNNKQQALFPENAMVITNRYGTANGCIIRHDEKRVVMLPGPPAECESVFTPHVMTELLTLNIHLKRYIKRWRVFGVSESHIATTLDEMIKNTGTSIGYRIEYPYIEIKLFSHDQAAFEKTVALFAPFLAQYCLSDPFQKASEKLAAYLNQNPLTLNLHDHATEGYWQSKIFLLTQQNAITFQAEQATAEMTIDGLKEIWTDQGSGNAKSTLSIEIIVGTENFKKSFTVPFRDKRTLSYAAEIISDYLLYVTAQTAKRSN